MVNKEAYINEWKKWKNRYPNLIKEGPVCWGKYLESKTKILWILKEAADDENDLIRYLSNISNKDFHEYSWWQRSMGLVIKTSYGILAGGKEWDSWANDTKSLVSILKFIAVIEVNKDGGGAATNNKKLREKANKYKDLISKQIEYLSPNIVICGRTFSVLMYYVLNKENKSTGKHGYAEIMKKCLWIDAYHPNQKRITHEEYYRYIMASTKETGSSLHMRQTD